MADKSMTVKIIQGAVLGKPQEIGAGAVVSLTREEAGASHAATFPQSSSCPPCLIVMSNTVKRIARFYWDSDGKTPF